MKEEELKKLKAGDVIHVYDSYNKAVRLDITLKSVPQILNGDLVNVDTNKFWGCLSFEHVFKDKDLAVEYAEKIKDATMDLDSLERRKLKKKKLFGINFIVNKNGYLKGFDLKRDITWTEALYIMDKLLGFQIKELYLSGYEDKEECEWEKEYVRKSVNNFLRGDVDLMFLLNEYAAGCEDDSLCVYDIFNVANYLKEKNIV